MKKTLFITICFFVFTVTVACSGKNTLTGEEEVADGEGKTFSQRPVHLKGEGILEDNRPLHLITIERWSSKDEEREGIKEYRLYIKEFSPFYLGEEGNKKGDSIHSVSFPLKKEERDIKYSRFQNSGTNYYAAVAVNREGLESEITFQQSVDSPVPLITGLKVLENGPRCFLLDWGSNSWYDTYFIFKSEISGFALEDVDEDNIFTTRGSIFEECFEDGDEGTCYYYRVLRERRAEVGDVRRSPPSEEVKIEY